MTIIVLYTPPYWLSWLQDSSPSASPQSATQAPPFFQTHPSSANTGRISGRLMMCVMLVICFFADPFSLSGGQLAGVPSSSVHGSQRTLNSLDVEVEGVVTLGWVLMWTLRWLLAGVCFGVVWLYSIPKHNPNWEGVRFWRLRKQAEQDIKKVLYMYSSCKHVLFYLLQSCVIYHAFTCIISWNILTSIKLCTCTFKMSSVLRQFHHIYMYMCVQFVVRCVNYVVLFPE